MSFYKVELGKYFNHRLFYDNIPSTIEGELGLENSYILKENNSLLGKTDYGGVKFFCEFNDMDNVICNGQVIEVDLVAKKIHFLAISTWIDTIEYFDIVFGDGTVEKVKIPFLNWVEYSGTNCELYYYDKEEKVKTVSQCITTGNFRRLVSFHHSYSNIREDKVIKKIILPDNLLVHIFAITLEN